MRCLFQMRLRSLGPKAQICFLFASRPAFFQRTLLCLLMPWTVLWGGEKCCHFLFPSPTPLPPPAICPRLDTQGPWFKSEMCNSVIFLSMWENEKGEACLTKAVQVYQPAHVWNPTEDWKACKACGRGSEDTWGWGGSGLEKGTVFPAWRGAEGIVTPLPALALLFCID